MNTIKKEFLFSGSNIEEFEKRWSPRRKLLLFSQALEFIKKELSKYRIKHYLSVVTPFNYAKSHKEKLAMIKGQSETVEKRYADLINKLSRRVTDRHIEWDLLKWGFKENWSMHHREDSIKHIAKELVSEEIKILRGEKRQDWDILKDIKNKRKPKDKFDIESEEQNQAITRTTDVAEDIDALDTTLIYQKLTAELSEKEKDTLNKCLSTGETGEDFNTLVAKIKEKHARQIEEFSKETGISKTAKIKTSKAPLQKGLSPIEYCSIINDLGTDWFMDMFQKGFEKASQLKPPLLKEIEKFYGIPLRYPGFRFTYLNKVAKNLGIKPEKLKVFFDKIKFAYIYPIPNIRQDKKKLYLIDEDKLDIYLPYPTIQVYFYMEQNYKAWRKKLGCGFTKARASHFMERKIKKMRVPHYYFDLVEPKDEYVSYLLDKKQQPLTELPKETEILKDYYINYGWPPLTHKQLVKALRIKFSKD